MAVQDVLINTNIRVTNEKSDLEILISYQAPGQEMLEFFVANSSMTKEGVAFVPGDLGYTYDNVTAIFELNSIGDLIVNDINVTKYSINSAGDLIVTE